MRDWSSIAWKVEKLYIGLIHNSQYKPTHGTQQETRGTGKHQLQAAAKSLQVMPPQHVGQKFVHERIKRVENFIPVVGVGLGRGVQRIRAQVDKRRKQLVQALRVFDGPALAVDKEQLLHFLLHVAILKLLDALSRPDDIGLHHMQVLDFKVIILPPCL